MIKRKSVRKSTTSYTKMKKNPWMSKWARSQSRETEGSRKARWNQSGKTCSIPTEFLSDFSKFSYAQFWRKWIFKQVSGSSDVIWCGFDTTDRDSLRWQQGQMGSGSSTLSTGAWRNVSRKPQQVTSESPLLVGLAFVFVHYLRLLLQNGYRSACL